MKRLNYVVCLYVIFNFVTIISSELFYLIKENGELVVVSENNRDVSNTLWLSRVEYKNDINETGFAYVELEGQASLEDFYQAYSVGYLEGKVTYDLIYSQWFNTVNDFRTTMNKTAVKSVDEFAQKNANWVKTQIKNNRNDSYWYHVDLFYNQMKGMYDGYSSAIKDNELPDRYLTFNDFQWLTLFYDLIDLYDALGGTKEIGQGHCSVLIKILPNNNDIYFGHNTWTSYQNMLRMQKKYILNFNLSPDKKEKIPGVETTFTGYPGTIASVDDFYLISSGLAATETTNEVFNRDLWENLTPKNLVWETVRSVIANRLASNGENWSNIFKQYNSGTYNNQWMILDYKKFKTGKPLPSGTFWVIEQMPTKIIANDLTKVISDKGYWSSYNIPYYKEIYELSGYNKKLKELGNWFSYENAPRPQIFKRDQTKVTDMESFMKLMRSNDYKNDPFAKCSCNPPYSATGAIAARNDLNPINGTYSFKGQGHRPSGAIDAKITNSKLFLKLQFIAVSGPTTGTDNQLPPFEWSKCDFSETPHISQPNVWNFSPVLHKWTLP